MTPMSNLSSPESDGGPPTPPDDLRLPENLDQKSEYFGSQPCSTANSPTAPDMLKSNSAFSPSGKTNASSVTSPGPSPGSARKEDILSIFSLSNSDVQFDPATGSCQLAFSGCIPRAKTMHHWSVGETCLTNGLSVRFYFAVCVSRPPLPELSQPRNSFGSFSLTGSRQVTKRTRKCHSAATSRDHFLRGVCRRPQRCLSRA